MEEKGKYGSMGASTMALVSRDPAAIAAAEGAKARIQSAYLMAMNNPRNEDQARIKILEACKRPAFAERVEFSKPVSGKAIKGPSIRFAELALREWTNILAETQTLYEDDFIRRVKVCVLDLETNAQFSKEIQVQKTVERKKAGDREVIGERTNTNNEKVYIVKATDDELNNKESALISKALRNEGLRIIPSDITDEALEVARRTLRDRDARDPKEAKKKVLDAFASINISPKELEKYLKHSVDTISPAELEDLRGVYTAIKEGATWAEYINPPERIDPEDDMKKNANKKPLDIVPEPEQAKPEEKAPAQEEQKGLQPEEDKIDCPKEEGTKRIVSFCQDNCKDNNGCGPYCEYCMTKGNEKQPDKGQADMFKKEKKKPGFAS